MAGLIFDKAQIEQTIDAVVARTMRMDMTWDWPCGVAYYGICEAYEVTGVRAANAYHGAYADAIEARDGRPGWQQPELPLPATG